MVSAGGVLEATLIAVAVAVLIAWWTARHTSANLISCVMGIMPVSYTHLRNAYESGKP